MADNVQTTASFGVAALRLLTTDGDDSWSPYDVGRDRQLVRDAFEDERCNDEFFSDPVDDEDDDWAG